MLDQGTIRSINETLMSLEDDARKTLRTKTDGLPAYQAIKAIRWSTLIKAIRADSRQMARWLIAALASSVAVLLPSQPLVAPTVLAVPLRPDPRRSPVKTRGPNGARRDGQGFEFTPLITNPRKC